MQGLFIISDRIWTSSSTVWPTRSPFSVESPVTVLCQALQSLALNMYSFIVKDSRGLSNVSSPKPQSLSFLPSRKDTIIEITFPCHGLESASRWKPVVLKLTLSTSLFSRITTLCCPLSSCPKQLFFCMSSEKAVSSRRASLTSFLCLG